MFEKIPQNQLPLFALLMLVVANIACGAVTFGPTPTPAPTPTPSRTEQHMTYANTLRSAIDSFEASRNDVSAQIAFVSNKISEMSGENTNQQSETQTNGDQNDANVNNSESNSTDEGASLAIMWENEWVKVHTKFNDLSQRFQTIKTAAGNYFQELDKITETITNAEIKALEQEKNRQLKEEWNTAYEQAASDLGALDGLINEGDDFEKRLQLALLRAELSDSIVQLQEVSIEAQNLLTELGQLTIEGRKLVPGQSGL